ncbi:4Fe-4S dicluster domain-containing protein [Candidatus Omnitrophota bacterium]
MKKGMILIDPKKCLTCRTCELQCAIAHSKSKDLVKAICEEPLPQVRLKVEGVDDLGIPLQCRHCEDAPCIKICPTKATARLDAESPVLIKKELCIGCKWCVLVCPFGVIRAGRGGAAVTKCDLCFERLNKDELPACVAACPSKALQFESIEDINKQKKKDFLVQFKKSKEAA